MSSHFFKVKNGISFPPQTSYPTDPQDKDIIYRGDLGQLMIYTGGAWTNMLNSGSGGGVIKATLWNSTATTLPTGANATIDGIAVANDNLVLFTNLSSGNNQVYKVSGVGTALVWTAQSTFSNSVTPTTGDLLYITTGAAGSDTFLVFSTSWQPLITTERFATLGENVTANDIVYLSVGNAAGDTGRNAGMLYRIDLTNPYRCAPVGFVKKAQNSGNIAKYFKAGVATYPSTPDATGKTAYASSYSNAFATPAALALNFPTYNVIIGQFLSNTTVYFTAEAPVIIPRYKFTLNPTNTPVTIGTATMMSAFLDSNLGGQFEYTIALVDTSSARRFQRGTFRFYSDLSDAYTWSQDYMGDDCDVTFSIANGGALQHTSLTTTVAAGSTVEIKPATIKQLNT